jgi:hypothetical protein
VVSGFVVRVYVISTPLGLSSGSGQLLLKARASQQLAAALIRFSYRPRTIGFRMRVLVLENELKKVALLRRGLA